MSIRIVSDQKYYWKWDEVIPMSVSLLYCSPLVRWRCVLLGAICFQIGTNGHRARSSITSLGGHGGIDSSLTCLNDIWLHARERIASKDYVSV